MADTDVIGIVSLLLAAGGAVYLFRARARAQQAAAAAAEADAAEAPKATSRDPKTVPFEKQPPSPQTGKSGSSPLDSKAEASAPKEKREKLKEAKDTQVSRTDPRIKAPEPVHVEEAKPAPRSADTKGSDRPKKDEPKKDEAKKDEAKKDEAKKDEPKKDEAKKDEAKKDEAKKDGAKPKDAPKADPLKAAKPEAPKPADSKTKESKPKVVSLPKPAEKGPDPARSKAPEPKAAEAKPPLSTPKPAEAIPESKVARKSDPKLGAPLAPLLDKKLKKQTIVGLPEPANAPVGIAPKPAPVEKLPELPKIDIPRIDVEEDEDVEPTRVGRPERPSIRPPVEKHVFDEGADTKDERKSRPLELRVFALAQSDPGKRRKQNEDSYLVRDPLGLYVVADGMGGHRGGEFASKCAVDTIAKAFETKKFDAEAHADIPAEASELARAIQMANTAILAEAAKRPELKGMGTTLCAALFTEDKRRLFLGHVGDSRCYRVRGGTMTQMTKDHTMADYGIAGPEGAHLSRALGVWPTVPIDVIMAAPELNDLYLICSDGLTKMLTNETIATQLLHEEEPKAAVERLVFFANAHGGKDNITVILLRVVEPGWKPPSERGGS